MLKIGILTINDYNNYGNRLQNFAMQEILHELNLKCCTIVNNTTNSKLNRRQLIVNRLMNITKLEPRQIYSKIKQHYFKKTDSDEITEIKNKRNTSFMSFTRDNIIETDYVINDRNINIDNIDDYDYFITGSDQVWNPNFGRVSEIDFLTFAHKKKRIAYSPSFGVSKIQDEYVDKYKVWLAGIHKISVREDDGAKIIEELTGRVAPVLVDPTLLLTREKWLSISKEASNKPDGKYLLTYFLGGVPKEYSAQIKKIAIENNLEVINLGDIEEKETYQAGPSEFIDYINSCSIFCTDSFHGTVFSILFEKPFIVYERKGTSLSMFSRLNTLLDKFQLESRKVEHIKNAEDVFNIDYSHVPEILKKERNKSFEYLKDALNITNEA